MGIQEKQVIIVIPSMHMSNLMYSVHRNYHVLSGLIARKLDIKQFLAIRILTTQEFHADKMLITQEFTEDDPDTSFTNKCTY